VTPLDIVGDNYPPPPDKVFIANIVFYIQITLFIGVFCIEAIFKHLEMPVPEVLQRVKDNKFAAFMMIWMLGNVIQGGLLNTGAFEVYNGKEKIWSSLEHHRLPTQHDLMEAFSKSGIECVTGTAVHHR